MVAWTDGGRRRFEFSRSVSPIPDVDVQSLLRFTRCCETGRSLRSKRQQSRHEAESSSQKAQRPWPLCTKLTPSSPNEHQAPESVDVRRASRLDLSVEFGRPLCANSSHSRQRFASVKSTDWMAVGRLGRGPQAAPQGQNEKGRPCGDLSRSDGLSLLTQRSRWPCGTDSPRS
jgi:hypothetical protein